MRVIVVGAGFAGLAAATELERRGCDVLVYEARMRVGGRVRSHELANGAVVELGAEFILPEHQLVREVAGALGLELIEKGTTYGRREPRGGPPVSDEQLERSLERLDAALAARPPGAERQSAAALIDSLGLPAGAAEAIKARVQVSSACAVDELDASELAGAGAHFGPFATHGVAGGNQRLADRLAAQLAGCIYLGTPVERVAWDEDGARVHGGGAEAEADAVVIAAPAAVLGRIRFDPPLPAPAAQALARVRCGQAAKLFVPLAAPPTRPSALLSVPDRYWTWTTRGADGRLQPVLSAFAGSEPALEALDVARGPERWLACARALRPDLEIDGEPPLLATWADDEWARGAYTARHVGTPPEDAARLAQPVGPLHFAGEHTAGEWSGQMEGALRSGVRAAAEIVP